MNIVAKYKNGLQDVDILGFVTYWTVNGIDITRDKLISIMKACNLNEKLARQHNYRCAVIRSLRDMEEARIIRLVHEDPARLLYQFTAENKIGEVENARLEYDPETVVTIDKDMYRDTQDLAKSVSGRPDIVEKLLALFNEKKDKYGSSDITRLVQRIFNEKADIVALRPQGGVYFIPSNFADVVESVKQMLAQIGNSTFESLPMPNVESCRAAVKNAVQDEMNIDIVKLEKELDSVKKGETEVTDKWFQNRLDVITKAKARIDQYVEILGEGSAKIMADTFTKMESFLAAPRKLDL